MERKLIIAGNWKMNTSIEEGVALASQVKEIINDIDFDTKKYRVLIIPPFSHLGFMQTIVDNKKLYLGAQNVAAYDKGAYTGEVAAFMLASANVQYVIIGHSERRKYFSENSQILLKKLKLALENNLKPIFCIGETLEEREANKHFEVIENQLTETVLTLNSTDFANIVIAYEPVWAIGTGKTATKEQAQQMHAFIRNLIAQKFDNTIAKQTTILYGGSLKPKNAAELLAQPDIDGGLIGGASLKATDFTDIFKTLLKLK